MALTSLCDSRSARAGLPLCRCVRLSWVSLLVSSEKTNVTNEVRCVLALLHATQLGNDDSRTHTAHAPGSNLLSSGFQSSLGVLLASVYAHSTGQHRKGRQRRTYSHTYLGTVTVTDTRSTGARIQALESRAARRIYTPD